MNEWKTIDTAPRDGTLVELALLDGYDDDETYFMRWNQRKTNGLTPFLVGMWEMDGAMRFGQKGKADQHTGAP